ncbi:NAD(P)/FAD-dependent oxidoreductase [Paracraurococcus ruber]|uniref:Monooxygenase n=2 Tax=Paracraurococcus ruber TaxID=77675 RepID=A0ABS1CU43_9PROT|nr:NAD(P)/FAD-dependent oxidoreductase [Paracraurococcus ruber]MBK1657925.1 monooxygenase [Paracraurococcus ruber]TDG33126.1 NAD(P)/FAD-dependent oxidoreductase [Paracraurococcus ruber]
MAEDNGMPEARVVRDWLDRFGAALGAGDAAALAACFAADGHWRDVVGLGWRIASVSGAGAVAAALLPAATARGAQGFALDPDRVPPRRVERAGTPCIEAILRFDTAVGPGHGVLRLRQGQDEGASAAWTLMTGLADIAGHDEESVRLRREEPAFERDWHGPNWLDRRRAAARYADREPAVLVVGGGHAGLTCAATLKALGVEALVVDRYERIGDNWRRRYHGLKLHNTLPSNHLPYLPFPRTWPNYIPKDKIADWLEFYAEAMEIDVWTRTGFEGAEQDAASGRWTARLRLADGSERVVRPRHIVMATSVSGTPKLPEIPTLDRFGGAVVHSSGFASGAAWRGRPVLVFGTGTSAHDIAQDLHGNGAQVTMVQRSPTLVVNVEPSAQLYDGIYSGPGPSQADRDLLNQSFPLPVMKQAHRLLTDRARALDAELLAGLERAGFRLEFGEDGTGWPLKYRTRGGGYYFNVGCSELIVRGEIGLVQYADIEGFEAAGPRLKDGRLLPADLAVLATGYQGHGHLLPALFGPAVAARVGRVWGFDENQELRNMWMRTPQRGLWFTGGSFSQCRMYSKPLALQILAEELGLA